MDFPYDAFRRNPDGSWSPINGVTIKGPMGEITIGAGAAFRPGVSFFGLDVAAILETHYLMMLQRQKLGR